MDRGSEPAPGGARDADRARRLSGQGDTVDCGVGLTEAWQWVAGIGSLRGHRREPCGFLPELSSYGLLNTSACHSKCTLVRLARCSALCPRECEPQRLNPRVGKLGHRTAVRAKWPFSSSLNASSSAAATSSVTASSSPSTALTIRSIHQTASLASGHAPACTSAVTAVTSPKRAASNRGVAPQMSRRWRSAPASNSKCTASELLA